MTTPATYSATQIITDALEKLGVYAPGEAVAVSDLNRGLTVLNDMLDQWQVESLFVFALTTLTIALQNTAPTYSIGPPGSAASITTGRPPRIQAGPGAASVNVGGTDTPINVVSQLEWSAIQSRSTVQGTPDTLFYDPQYPVGILNFSPTPNAAGMVATFYGYTPFYRFAALNTAAQFTQGTVDALKSNLAITAKPYFADAAAAIDPVVALRAETTKEFLRMSVTTSRAIVKRSPARVGRPSQEAAAQ